METSPLDFYLIPLVPANVFTARVTSKPDDPYVEIAYNTGVTGSFGLPLIGQTVHFGSTSGGSERGELRLRTQPTAGSGTFKVAESDDVGPLIQANDFITIKDEFRLWPRYPRFIQVGTNVTIFEDFDVAYTNQTNQWRPIAVAGPPGVAFLEGGSAQISFVGDRSFALADGATISSYLWTARNSSEGTSNSQGTEGGPVVFTWTTPGQHLISLQVTDSNGQAHTNYSRAIIIDPASPTNAVLNFDVTSDNFDFVQGGGEMSVTVDGDAGVDKFPEEAAIIHAARGTITTPTASWPFRGNLLFWGWILTDTVRQNPDNGDVSFRAGTIDAIMRNLTMFPVSLSDKGSPVQWTEAKDLTVDRAASFLWEWRSTLSLMTPIIPSEFTGLIRRQDFGPGDVYGQLRGELLASIFGNVVSSPQGVLYHTIDYGMRNAAERAATTTRKTLHKGIWVNDVTIEERQDYAVSVNQVKASGVFYPGGQVEDICPLFSESPGDAPKVYGKEQNFDRLILISQSDLNVRTGFALAKLIARYPIYRMQFLNDGAFANVPQELFPTIIEASDNDRELAQSINLMPRRVGRAYDHVGGFFTVSVDFEPETTGPAGITVDLPCGPPEQVLPGGQEPDPPTTTAGDPSALAGTTPDASFYFAPGTGATWARRVNGLTASQLNFQDMAKDPWSTFKQGYSPNNVIVWGCGPGFVARSPDSGQNWGNFTPYLSAPPNSWGDGTAPTVANSTLKNFDSSIFAEDNHYLMVEAQGTGSAWRGWIAKTADDGFNWDYFGLTGSVQTRPLRMMVDRGNGTALWVTTWEDGEFWLRKMNTSDGALTGRFSMGDALIGDIDATLACSPFARLGQPDEVFVYGRLDDPQGLGLVHVLRSGAGGVTGSWAVIENKWLDSICGSFAADEPGFYYAVRNLEN